MVQQWASADTRQQASRAHRLGLATSPLRGTVPGHLPNSVLATVPATTEHVLGAGHGPTGRV